MDVHGRLQQFLQQLLNASALRGEDRTMLETLSERMATKRRGKSGRAHHHGLKVGELERLATVAAGHGRSLERVLLPDVMTWIQHRATKDKPLIFVPAKDPRGEGVAYASCWDTLAAFELASFLPSSELVFVPLRPTRAWTEAWSRQNDFVTQQPWYDRFDNARVVLCIGSPRANHCSEVAAARIIGGTHFKQPLKNPPFWFRWPKDQPNFASCIAHDSDGSDFVVHARGKNYIVQRSSSQVSFGLDYGVVLLREWNDQLFVVMAGATGASTYGCSRILRNILPPEDNHARWGLVECQIDWESKLHDRRRLKSSRILQ